MAGQLKLLPPGALGNAVMPFVDELPQNVNSATFLAELIDLRGGYCLAEALADLDHVADAPTAAGPTALTRLDGVLAALETVAAGRRLARKNAFKRRYRFPTPARLLTLLQDSDNHKRAARFAWAPMADFLQVWSKRARFDIRNLREDTLESLTDLGGDAARLAQLERALYASTRHTLEALYRRVPLASERRFTQQLAQAIRAESELTLSAIEAWFAPKGWIRQTFDDAWVLTEGVVGGERRRLEALIESAR